MRLSEFWELADDVFGAVYSRSLAADLALEDGVDPRDVWDALCDAQEVPQARRWGSDRRRRPAGG